MYTASVNLWACSIGTVGRRGAVEVDVSDTGGDTTPDGVEGVPFSAPVAADVMSCAGVDVEETNGGACWI